MQRHSLDILLSIAQLPRATFYYHLKRMDRADKYEGAKAEITAIYHENKGRYGYRRITTELRSRNYSLNHKTVQRLMKELGLICRVRMKKYRSYKGEVGKIAPNLLNRDFHAEKPNQKWVTDVTEFCLFGEKLYLSPILDLHSSDLVSYTTSDRPVLSMVTTMLDKAFEKIPDGTNLILHSDMANQAQLLHEPLDCLVVQGNIAVVKFCRNAAVAVSTFVFVIDGCDFCFGSFIFVCAVHPLQMIVESSTGQSSD